MCQSDTVNAHNIPIYVAYVKIYALFGGTKLTQTLHAGDWALSAHKHNWSSSEEAALSVDIN